MKLKKLITIIVVMLMLVPALCWAVAGSCAQSVAPYELGIKVTFTCTGSSIDGSIPNTAISMPTMKSLILGKKHLYTVAAYPTAGGTAPDAADVFILDANGEDLLGSVDGGTTANKGANLIHATLKKTTLPYSGYLAQHYYPPVVNTLTLKVANQGTVNANYTIELFFER
jgi:hypothetical protein